MSVRRHTMRHTEQLARSGQRNHFGLSSGSAKNPSLLWCNAVPNGTATHIYEAIWSFETSEFIHPKTSRDNSHFFISTPEVTYSNFTSHADLVPHVFYVLPQSLHNSDESLLNLLKPTGHVMHQQFNAQQFTFCPHCIYVFCIYLGTNSDLCHLQHKLIGFYNRDEKCLLRGKNWVFK